MFGRAIIVGAGIVVGIYSGPVVADAVNLYGYDPVPQVVGAGVAGAVMLMFATLRKH